MELDKVANEDQTAQRAEQQNSDQKVDELMEKLRELARRQEQEAERQRQRAPPASRPAAAAAISSARWRTRPKKLPAGSSSCRARRTALIWRRPRASCAMQPTPCAGVGEWRSVAAGQAASALDG